MDPHYARPYPGKLQAISILHTVFGGLEIIIGLLWAFYVLFIGVLTVGIGLILFPIPLIFLATGIISLIAGIKGLQQKASFKLSMTASILEMVLILGCDFASFGAGLACVILLTQPEVKAYYGR